MYAQIYSSSGKEAGTEITKKEGDHTKTDCRGAITVHQGREKKKNHIHWEPRPGFHPSICYHMGRIQKKKKMTHNKARYNRAKQTIEQTQRFQKTQRLCERALPLSYPLTRVWFQPNTKWIFSLFLGSSPFKAQLGVEYKDHLLNLDKETPPQKKSRMFSCNCKVIIKEII